jgi:maltose O-acetyltransferase
MHAVRETLSEELEDAVTDPWAPRPGPLSGKLGRVAREELDASPRAIVAGVLSRMLPQLAFRRLRTALLRASGVRIGARSLIGGEIRITGTGSLRELLSIGEETFITGPLHVDLGGPVRIGDRVQMGHGVALVTASHEIGGPKRRCGPWTAAPIVIEDGVWLASHVLVLPGVTVGHGSVVAAGAVVVHDVPPDTLVAGVPARVVRRLTPEWTH